jgi:hypothetical protein
MARANWVRLIAPPVRFPAQLLVRCWAATMNGAGIREYNEAVEVLARPDPAITEPEQLLPEVHAAGVGNSGGLDRRQALTRCEGYRDLGVLEGRWTRFGVGIRRHLCVGHRVEHGREATQPKANAAPSPAWSQLPVR